MTKLLPLPVSQRLVLEPASLAVFLDETGLEDFSDRNFPIFGFGGCAVLGMNYQTGIVQPWRQLKAEQFGSETYPIHANSLGRLTTAQIQAINRFFRRNFHRLGVVADDRTIHTRSMDGHRAIALRLHTYVEDIAKRYPLDAIHFVFERSQRGTPLVVRDFDWIKRDFRDARGAFLPCTVSFMDKALAEPGLEIADVIAHTVGRQQRRWRTSPGEFEKDFEAIFHSRPRAVTHFISINETAENEQQEGRSYAPIQLEAGRNYVCRFQIILEGATSHRDADLLLIQGQPHLVLEWKVSALGRTPHIAIPVLAHRLYALPGRPDVDCMLDAEPVELEWSSSLADRARTMLPAKVRQ